MPHTKTTTISEHHTNLDRYFLILRDDRRTQYTATTPPIPVTTLVAADRNMNRVEPKFYSGWKTLMAVGVVREIVQLSANGISAKAGPLASALAAKIIERRSTQLTIVDVDLNSYTFLADLTGARIRKGDLVRVELEAKDLWGHTPRYRFFTKSISLAPFF